VNEPEKLAIHSEEESDDTYDVPAEKLEYRNQAGLTGQPEVLKHERRR
jgi:hypothetical protein